MPSRFGCFLALLSWGVVIAVGFGAYTLLRWIGVL
jgi:hypothetical protein